jgi:hypothetical protein
MTDRPWTLLLANSPKYHLLPVHWWCAVDLILHGKQPKTTHPAKNNTSCKGAAHLALSQHPQYTTRITCGRGLATRQGRTPAPLPVHCRERVFFQRKPTLVAPDLGQQYRPGSTVDSLDRPPEHQLAQAPCSPCSKEVAPCRLC